MTERSSSGDARTPSLPYGYSRECTHTREQQIHIGPDGKIRLIDHAELGPELGPVARQRASHVEPANWILRAAFRHDDQLLHL